MVDVKYTMILEQILDLLDTACQAALELLELHANGNAAGTAQLLQDMRAVVHSISATEIAPQLEHSGCPEMLENMEVTLDEIGQAIQQNNPERAAMKMEFQLLPFLRCLREAFYFWGTVYPDKERMDRYYQEEFAGHYRNPYVDSEQNVRLSIVVSGYNHVETTKKCVQHLLQVTDFEKLKAELILIDHGSTDGTLEYFESLGVGKVVHFQKNTRMYVFAAISMLCRGEYFSFVSNDILVTKDWADILLNCLRSDEKIIAAVPATPNIANLQALGLPDLGPKEFVSWANQQNKCDPACWNDRARLMPPLGMYRTEAVSRIGFADPYFYSMEYWDDDFSFRARRAGYRQIICNDVACYHFGSVTGREGQVKDGTLVYGRELFQKKTGIDPWGSGFCYDYTAVRLFKQLPLPQSIPAFLTIDCGMGDTPLQLRNELRHLGRDCTVWQLTSQKSYLPDISLLSDGAQLAVALPSDVRSAFGDRKFAFAYIGREIAEYEDSSELLSAVAARLLPGGYLVFSCTNPAYAATLHSLLQFSVPGGTRCVLADPTSIRQQAEQHFSHVQVVSLEQPVDGLENFAKQHYGRTAQLPQIIQRLKIQKYYFVCGK